MNTGLRRVVIILVLTLIRRLTTKETGREFQGRVVHAQALKSAPFKRFYTAGVLECAHRCLTHGKCASFNYNSTGEGQGLCGLHRKCARNRFPAEGFLPEHDSDHIFVQRFITKTKSCLDHYSNGKGTTGAYDIYDSKGEHYKAFCDMTSEEGLVWTLVMSQSYNNSKLKQLKSDGLVVNEALNEDHPNWSAYRLSRGRMNDLRLQSTHWRVTCSFPSSGVDYRDYVRAKFSQFNPLSFEGTQKCKRVEYMNVRGHNCTECTAPWSQKTYQMLHYRSDMEKCELGAVPDTKGNEQYFGYYEVVNRDPSFRCTEKYTSSTNHWFGAFV